VQALEQGRFYASTGVSLDTVERSSKGLEIAIREELNFKYTTRFVGKGGKVLAEVHGLEAKYELRPGEAYVRATVTRSDGRNAWVQPAFGG